MMLSDADIGPLPACPPKKERLNAQQLVLLHKESHIVPKIQQPREQIARSRIRTIKT
jgi:hypothetical protein